MSKLDNTYWTERYEKGHIGWDIGQASPPLISYCKSLDKGTQILIPGAGNAYEWEALHSHGFRNVKVIDISSYPIDLLREKHPLSQQDFIHGDFFSHTGKYDLILEQTFFCALNPELRPEYIQKMHQLLAKDGKLAGVLFDHEFEHKGPPFGGSENEYRQLFEDMFQLSILEPCYNSIGPRQGSELFFVARPQ